jgi:hypothetical protein
MGGEELSSILCVARPKDYGTRALCQVLDVAVVRSSTLASVVL